jgi:hypothetical protein
MATFRVEKTTGYTVMSNHHLRNKNLTLKSKGLLSLMLSLPEEWDYTLRGLAYICKENIDAIRTAISELEAAGYVERSRTRDEKGHLSGTEYVIYEQPKNPSKKQGVKAGDENGTTENVETKPFSPKLDFPTLENPTLENPTLGNPMQTSKDLLSKNILIKDLNNDPPNTPNPSHKGAAGPSSAESVYSFRGKAATAAEFGQLILSETGLGRITDSLAQIDQITGSKFADGAEEIKSVILRIITEAATGSRRKYEFERKPVAIAAVKVAFEKLTETQFRDLILYCMKKRDEGAINDLEAYVRTSLVNAAMGGTAAKAV